MKKIQTLWHGMILAALMISGARAEAPWTFGFMSDIHFGKTVDGTTPLDPATWTSNALDGFKKKNVDFILIGGDVIESSGSDAQLQLFKTAMQATTLPWYCSVGNHDIGSPPADVNKINKWIGSPYFFGRGADNLEYYGFTHKNAAIFVLDAVMQTSTNTALNTTRWNEQLAALDSFFTANADKPVKILCGHIPIFKDTRTEADDAAGNIAKTYRDQLLAKMDLYGIKYYVAGHRHVDRVSTDSSKPNAITSFQNTAMSFQLGTGNKRSYYIYQVTDSGLTRAEVLDPEKVLVETPCELAECRVE